MYKLLGNKKGFTLIEIVTVFSIALMLILLSVVYVEGVQSRKRDLKRTADAQEIVYALEQFYNYYGYYPDHTTDLISESPGGCVDTGWDDSDCNEFIPGLTGSNVREDNPKNVVFLKNVPGDLFDPDGEDDVCSGSYGYITDDDGQSFRLVIKVEEEPIGYNECEVIKNDVCDKCVGGHYICFDSPNWDSFGCE